MAQPDKIPKPALATAICLTILAGICFASTDAIGKVLASTTTVWQAAWARYTVQAVIVSIVLFARGEGSVMSTKRPFTQIIRGAALLGATLLMYAAILRIPLANATTIQLLAPLLVLIWAGVFLREQIKAYHLMAVAFGFIGAACVIGPQLEKIATPEVLLPLGVAFCMSIFLVLTRVLSGPHERACTQFASTAVGAVVLSVALPFYWVTPSLLEAVFMLIMGAIATLGHWGLVHAFSLAPASVLTPFLYSQVLTAAALTALWFGEVLSPGLVMGAAILIASGLFLWWQEQRQND